jgi:riboflavin kinase/FMN adenylyltransferase
MTRAQIGSGGSVIVTGIVQHGDHRGRTLGVPTANLALDDVELAEGVWAGWFVRADGQFYASAVSVGVRATFYAGDGARLLEAHLLDFDDDLYGESVTVVLVEYLRAQRAFNSRDALIEQMDADIFATRAWSASAQAPGGFERRGQSERAALTTSPER